MAESLGQPQTFVGVDVSEGRLDVHVLPANEGASFVHDPRGIGRLVAWLATEERALVVEATGGLERPLVLALDRAGIAVAVVNPRQVRDFARAAGLLAKTDRLDAHALALFAERLRPQPRRGTRRFQLDNPRQSLIHPSPRSGVISVQSGPALSVDRARAG